MKGEKVLLVKTASEISLKSSYVENYFLRRLRGNIRAALKNNGINKGVALEQLRGRIIVSGKNIEKISMVLGSSFGVHSFAFAEKYDAPSVEAISSAALAFAKRLLNRGDSFAVRAHKVVGHDFSSRDLNIKIGAEILETVPGLTVNLDAPEKELFIEVQPKSFFLFSSEMRGVRGLPLGVEGNVAFFFGGKKGELRAAWLLMKRGCSIFPVSENKKAVLQLKKLVPWNLWRAFSITKSVDLDSLVKARGIVALATADSGLSEKDFSKYKKFDEQFDLPVLRPLLLLPEKEIVLPEF